MWTHGRARMGAEVGRYSTSSLMFVWFRATAEVLRLSFQSKAGAQFA